MLTELLRQMSATVIGISVETDALRLAESHAGRVVRCVSKAYPPGGGPGSEGFAAFLRQTLTGFSAHWRRVPVWAVGHCASLQTRFLTVPTGRRREVGDMAYWAFRKDLPFDAGQTLFDYGIEGGDAAGDKTHVTAYTALREEVAALQALFAKAGIQLTGVVIPPFAMRAMMLADMDNHAGTRFGICAGEDASTVIILRDGKVCSSRVFKTGMQALLGGVREAEPDLAPAVACERMQAVLASGDGGEAASAQEKRIREVFDRLLQQIERTLHAYLNEHPGDTIAGMYVMGPLARFPVLTEEMRTRYGVEVWGPPVVPGGGAVAADGSLTALAAGAALAHPDRTPNLLCVSARRDQVARRSWLSILAALLLGLVGALLHLSKGVVEHANVRLARSLEGERARLAVYRPVVDERMLQALLAVRVAEQATWKGHAQRWLAPAVLHALGPLTPDTLRLTSVELALGEAVAPTRSAARGEGIARGGLLKLAGMVRGVQDAQRSTLAAYALRLEDSPLFHNASVRSVTDGQAGAEPVVLFEMELDIAGGIGEVAATEMPQVVEGQP